MEVNVKLFATFREGRFKEKPMEIDNGGTVLNVVKKCDLTPDEVAISMVNGRDVEREHKLQAGDTVALFPPVGGG